MVSEKISSCTSAVSCSEVEFSPKESVKSIHSLAPKMNKQETLKAFNQQNMHGERIDCIGKLFFRAFKKFYIEEVGG